MIFLCAVYLNAQNSELRVESAFEPSSITLSNSTIYKITIHGSQESPLGKVPSVPGLKFSSTPRTFRSASFINGVPSVRFELTFEVQPERQGTFRMPSWNLKVGTQNCQVPPATLQVLPSSQRDKIRQQEQKKQEQDLREAAFLHFSTPRPFMFEGETMEGKITLFIWNRLPVTRIDRIPTKEGDGFSITELGQPVENRNIERNGKVYNSYSWNFGITGALPGMQSISFSSVLRVRVKQSRNSPFGNPFFSDPFFGFGSEEGLEVKSDSISMEVRPLPQNGRPTEFTGAIGSFILSSSIDRDRVSLGDPVRLTCKIKGSGNFSAIPAPSLSLGQDIKAGPPAFNFEGSASTMHLGEQSFEYVLTPQRPGLLEIEPVRFSFFDPDKQNYQTLSTQAHSLRVDPGEKWIEPVSQEGGIDELPAQKSVSDMFQTESEPGDWVNSITVADPLRSKLFWLIHAVGLILFCLFIVLRIKSRDPLLEERKLKDRVLENKIKDAVKHGDRAGFYKHLSRRIRLRISMACPDSNPSALSSIELLNLLKKHGFSNTVTEGVSQLLETCENSEFSGGSESSTSLESELRHAQSILGKLK